ncbi:hypothetical protein [Streptomyces sp. TRM64462]|uniref:hypothetical protein n=1 Tax=Streptomyces sp. TRM64462 TaxID=2741726 RepID=UPI001586549A|nr:hypothetical protein [Streptomyces sp. TRM64462]
MNITGFRVALAVPTSWEWYFEPRRKWSIAWYVERSLRIAGEISSECAVDVFLYGESARTGATDVVRTRVDPDSLAGWLSDWAVRPNLNRPIFEDRLPPNLAEETFGRGEQPWYGRPLPVVRAVSDWADTSDIPAFVLFWLDRKTQSEEIVRFIGTDGAARTYWQFFGDPDDVDYRFWKRDGLSRGEVLPSVRFRFDKSWRLRPVLREFARWRATSLS